MVVRRRLRLLGGLVLGLLGLGLADALWLEPHILLLEDTVRIDLDAPRLRLVHLSDLHISGDRPLLHRLLGEVRRAKPDLIVVSGDFVRDVQDGDAMAKHIAATAAFVSGLRHIAPVIGVQGHSEHQGDVLAALDQAGAELLSNEGRRIGRDGGLLLLGLNTQVGEDARVRSWPDPFRIVRRDGKEYFGARRDGPFRNFYSHWDPAPLALTDTGGPLSWSGYDVLCDALIDDEITGAGLVAHSRFVLGEDRMYTLTRGHAKGLSDTFSLWARGTTLAGHLDTGVVPEPGRWYRMRLRTEVEPGVVRLLAKVWPADGTEPRQWQAHAEDRSRHRIEAGTVGLWAWGGGTVAYRDLRVVGAGREILMRASLRGPKRPEGFREDPRGTRLAMALARSPYVPPGTPTVVVSHTPSVALEASLRGIDAVLAGHTHGGQIRLPFFGALTTRDALGSYYDFGRFDFGSPSPRGRTTLYINAGIGTSVLPVRFWCPPRYGVVELGAAQPRSH